MASAGITLEDREAARSILKQRTQAVAKLAGLTEILGNLPDAVREDALIRLESAVKAGEAARHRLLQLKRATIVEWGRWNHVHLALAPAESGKLDCRG